MKVIKNCGSDLLVFHDWNLFLTCAMPRAFKKTGVITVLVGWPILVFFDPDTSKDSLYRVLLDSGVLWWHHILFTIMEWHKNSISVEQRLTLFQTIAFMIIGQQKRHPSSEKFSHTQGIIQIRNHSAIW